MPHIDELVLHIDTLVPHLQYLVPHMVCNLKYPCVPL